MIFSTSLFAVTVVKNRKILFDGIVTPDKPFPVVSFAAKELSYHFRRATGKALPIIKESAAKPGAKYFYLGSCKFNASLNSARLPWATGIIKINKD